MTPARRVAAGAAGILLLVLARFQLNAVLSRKPLHAYDFEYFLKLAPGEGLAYLWIALLGIPATALLAWGLAPGLDALLRKAPTLPAGRWLLAAGGLAAMLTAIIGWGLLDGQVLTDDENVYVFQARTLLTGRAVLPAPAGGDFLENVFVAVRDGRWFGQYPPGHPLMLLGGVLLGLPRLIPVLLAGLNVLLFGLLLRALLGEGAARVGIFFWLLSPLFLLTGSTLLSHGTALACLTLAVLAGVRVRTGGGLLWGLLAGLGVGGLILTRPWTGVTLGLFPGILLLHDAVTRRRVIPVAGAIATLGICAVFFLGYNRAVTGDPTLTGYQALRGSEMIEFGFGVISPGVHDHTPGQGLLNMLLLALRFHFWVLGWPLVILPALWAWRRSKPAPGPGPVPEKVLALGAAAMLGVGFLSYIPYWSIGVNDTGPVKTFELLLPFGVLSALGMMRWARTRGTTPVAAWMVSSWLAAAMLLWPLAASHLSTISDHVAEPLRVVESTVRRPALVFVGNVQPPEEKRTWVFGRPNPRPDLGDPILYVRDLGARNLEYARLHPGRTPYRLTHDGEQFVAAPLFGDQRR